MRRFLIAAAMAVGLIALWAAILPLTAQPALPTASHTTTARVSTIPAVTAPTPTTPAAATISKALFLCRGQHGIDQACAAALAKALVLDASEHAVTQVSDRICRADPQVFASMDHRD